MTTATQTATPRWRLPQPVRAALHWMLLRGLRAPRLPHESGWADGTSGAWGITPLQVRGARGQHLAAWLALPRTACAAQPVPVVVAVHGWGANGSTLAPMVEPLARAGIAVMLFDAASHGDSSAEAFSSLPRFAEDLAAVLDALRGHPAIDAGRIGLLGHSVGAAAVLLHTARQGGVRAVVSLSAILEHVQEVIGERFDHIAPEHQLAHIACPVMLVHGEQDRTVPLSDAHRLRALLRSGELLVVKGDHDLRVALAPHAEELVRFFSTHLEAKASACLNE
jgi:pimeloyl-ACP methyl ester carboxylesterase